MNRNVILFDLDGTLLPMDLNVFEQAYFAGLCAEMKELRPEDIVKSVWDGTKAMFANDGRKSNREVFAEVFTKASNFDFYENEERILKFYQTTFQECEKVCFITDTSKKIIRVLKEKGYRVAVATNPIFPKVATYSRLRWLGLIPEDFELVTTYEECHYAKPNPAYFTEVCERLQIKPEDCVMIGNDVVEDGCAVKLGIEVMLVTDYLITHGKSADGFWQGTLDDVLKWAEELPKVSNRILQEVE